MLKPILITGAALCASLICAQGILAIDRSVSLAEARVPVAGGQPQVALGLTPIRKAEDGHFWATGSVNGRPIRFLVDTGATAVALTPEDARKAGLDVAALNFSQPVITAMGETRAAPVTLSYVTVSGARIEAVPALVIEDGLNASLLGMSYLGRLDRFEADQQTLTLHP